MAFPEITFTVSTNPDAEGGVELSATHEGYEPRFSKSPATAHRNQPLSSDILLGAFSIVDIETTGFSAERDAIIEIAAINVGPAFQVVSEYTALVKTEAWIPHKIVELTGITQANLNSRGVPLANAIAQFLDHVSGRPIFAHNAKFDYGFLARAAEQCGKAFDNPMHDSIQVAAEAWPGLRSYKLSTLAELLGLDHVPTHRALDDVKTTLSLLRAAQDALSGARTWNLPVQTLPSHEHHSIARLGNADGPLHGNSIVFTGELSLTRERAAEVAAQAGCSVTPSVTKKTTLLVVGTQDLSTLAGHYKSSKHRKAEALIAKGQAIRIVSESDFLQLLNIAG